MSNETKSIIFPFGLHHVNDNHKTITPEMKDILGGKGASLACMSSLGFNVPPGITFSTRITSVYEQIKMDNVKDSLVCDFAYELSDIAIDNLDFVVNHFGYMPLLSVRSGASVSMPGMMDTVLNVGINRNNLNEWSKRLGERAAMDCYVRLLQTIATSIYQLNDKTLDDLEEKAKNFKYGLDDNPSTYSEFTVKHLDKLASYIEDKLNMMPNWFVDNLIKVQFVTKGKKKPEGYKFSDFINESDTPLKNQLSLTILTVLESWNSERAIAYREINNLTNIKGTAVNIQAMVFGNYNNMSCSGVLFTRDPTTGRNEIKGEYLVNAQGEDVVSGSRTPNDIHEMESTMPVVYKELVQESKRMETIFKEMMDIEFTIQDGELFFLQCREGKRSSVARFVIANDFIKEGIWNKEHAKNKVSAKRFRNLVVPSVDKKFHDRAITKGTPASGHVVSGRIVLSSKEALEAEDDVILVTFTTTPKDISGMNKAKGILTCIGGVTSHAAVVARGMDKTCVVGCEEIEVWGDHITIGKKRINRGETITIDGQTGYVWQGDTIEVNDSKFEGPILCMILDSLENADKFNLNINDIYINAIDGSLIADKVVLKVKPHHLNSELDKNIKNVLDNYSAYGTVRFDISHLKVEDPLCNTHIGNIIQVNEGFYKSKNIEKFLDSFYEVVDKYPSSIRFEILSENSILISNMKKEGNKKTISFENKNTYNESTKHLEAILFN